jgi:hypothetical protein
LGREKASWYDKEDIIEKNTDNTETIKHITIKRKEIKNLCDIKTIVTTFNSIGVAKGDYTFSFSLPIPVTLPGSINFKNKSIEKKPKGKIKYILKASHVTNLGKVMASTSSVVHIIKLPFSEQSTIKLENECNVSTWCLVD